MVLWGAGGYEGVEGMEAAAVVAAVEELMGFGEVVLV